MPSGIYVRTEEHKQKISKGKKGQASWHKGKHLTEEHKRKISEAHKGKHHTKETKQKLSEINKGKSHTEERKRKISEAHKEKHHTEETKKKMSEERKGRKLTENTKEKMRIAAIKRIKKKNENCFPNYSEQACEYFKKFDEMNNTKGRYAVYGGGEYLIKELGYWPDYINFDMKLIIEWDEKYHNKQVKKDMRRQKKIMEHYPDFKFKRIKK